MRRLSILLPIEFLNRELDVRLFLAARMTRPDLRFIIGHDDLIHKLLPQLRGGVYVGRNIHRPRFPHVDQSLYCTLKARDFVFVHLDEEGAVHPGDEATWREVLLTRLDPNCLAAEDAICTWGDWQRDVYRSLHPPCEPNIQTTGHPRFDLYSPPYREYFASEVEAIRARYGDFVLLNTNLFRANNRRGLADTFSAKRGFDGKDEKRLATHTAHWGYHTRLLTHFVELAAFLSRELPQTNIVVRPHPSENFDFYRAIFENVPSVHVLHEGNVAPWLLAARCLIHDGCTTAIEAHLCQTPIINYKPLEDARFDKFLPNVFGVRCHDESEVLRALQRVQNCEAAPPVEIPARAKMLFANFEQAAFEPLESAINSAAERVTGFEEAPVRALRGNSWRAKADKITGLASLGPRKSDSRFHPQFGLRPFYGFEYCDIPTKMERIEKILSKDVRYSVLSSRLMTVES